jgi:hypothetical protein
MRRCVLTSVAMLIFLGGCGSDLNRIAINHTLDLMEQTTTKLKALTGKVKEAAQKLVDEKFQKELDLADATKLCDDLKKFCKDPKTGVQQYALEIQRMRLNPSDADKEELRREFGDRINKRVVDMHAETVELDKAMKDLEDKANTGTFTESMKKEAKKSIEELKKKLGEAQAEFESLNRK